MTDDPSHVKSLEKLLNTVYSPFRPYILKYRTFEELALNNELDNIRLVSRFRTEKGCKPTSQLPLLAYIVFLGHYRTQSVC